jgi:hypothetical protein
MHHLSSAHSVTIPLHVSGLLGAQHQELIMYLCYKWYVLYVLFDRRRAESQQDVIECQMMFEDIQPVWPKKPLRNVLPLFRFHCHTFVYIENCHVIFTIIRLLTSFLPYLLTSLFTTWSKVLLEKLTDFQLVKKFPSFYGTRRFVTAFTRARLGH